MAPGLAKLQGGGGYSAEVWGAVKSPGSMGSKKESGMASSEESGLGQKWGLRNEKMAKKGSHGAWTETA